MESQIYYYYYLDESGIDTLFAQSGKLYINQIIHKKLKAIKGSGKGKVSVGNLFKLLGLGKVDLEGKLAHEKIGSEEFNEIFRVEHKLKIILDLLKKKNQLVLLTEDKFNPKTIKVSQFVDLEGTFKLPDYKEVSNKTKILNKQLSNAFYFSKIDGISLPVLTPFVEFYCYIGDSVIRMGTSLEKYSMGLSHFLIIWHYEEVKLRVFGELTTSASEGEYYLKPFSIRHA